MDEIKSHARREGMFNAVSSWLLKFSSSVTIFFSGYLLAVVGWDTALEAEQSSGTFLAMRIAFSGCTILLAIFAALALRGFRVTEESLAEARAQSATAS